MPRQFTVNLDTLEAIDVDLSELQEEEQQPVAPLPEAATRGMVPQSTPEGDPSVADQWPGLNPAEKARAVLQWGGNAIAGMTGMGSAGREAVENPGTTLATAGVGAAAQKAAPMIPTRAKAAEKFKQVMGKVGSEPVDIARPGDSALRIAQLAERGGSMPKVVRDLLKRATDPAKPDIDYREARDFYSNISRLSADEMQRLTPVMKRELGELRSTLDRALSQAAARGGQERAYRAAMREYAVASRIREFAEKAAKWGAGIAGAGTAYGWLKD